MYFLIPLIFTNNTNNYKIKKTRTKDLKHIKKLLSINLKTLFSPNLLN